MGIRDRTRRLEKRAGLDKDGPCHECGGRIIFAEHRPDGTIEYPMGRPCSTCGNRPADGGVGIVRVMLSTDGTAEKTRKGGGPRMAMKDRLRRLEARTPTARGEEAIRAEACSRMSTEDLTVMSATLRRLDEMGAGELGWEELLGEFPEDERAAFEAAWGRYEEAVREARLGR